VKGTGDREENLEGTLLTELEKSPKSTRQLCQFLIKKRPGVKKKEGGSREMGGKLLCTTRKLG